MCCRTRWTAGPSLQMVLDGDAPGEKIKVYRLVLSGQMGGRASTTQGQKKFKSQPRMQSYCGKNISGNFAMEVTEDVSVVRWGTVATQPSAPRKEDAVLSYPEQSRGATWVETDKEAHKKYLAQLWFLENRRFRSCFRVNPCHHHIPQGMFKDKPGSSYKGKDLELQALTPHSLSSHFYSQPLNPLQSTVKYLLI